MRTTLLLPVVGSLTVVAAAGTYATLGGPAPLIVVGASFLVALVIAVTAMTRFVRDLRSVDVALRRVGGEQIPALVAALESSAQSSPIPDVPRARVGRWSPARPLAGSVGATSLVIADVARRQNDVMAHGLGSTLETLARRNTRLLDTQLALLDELERNAEDPELLRRYFSIDHLASRMRRNAQSLLVMSRRPSAPTNDPTMPVADVIRAGLSEIEDYQRVDVQDLDDADLRGVAVGDVAHVLAELFDNATAFSPPSTHVSVVGRRSESGYLVTISDEGMGVSLERADELNRLLIDPPALGLGLHSQLGLVVVALLARKHGIGVLLQPQQTGLAAHVLVPDDLLIAATLESTLENDDPVANLTPAEPPEPATPTEPLVPPVADHGARLAELAPSVSPSDPSPVLAPQEFAARDTPRAQAPPPDASDRLLDVPQTEPSAAATPSVSDLPRRTPGASMPDVGDDTLSRAAAGQLGAAAAAFSKGAATAKRPSTTASGLPTRTPGTNFRGDLADARASVAASSEGVSPAFEAMAERDRRRAGDDTKEQTT